MNDSIKTLIAGAVIALFGAAFGAGITSWSNHGAQNPESSAERKASVQPGQRPSFATSPNQFRAPPPRPPGGTNSIFRPGPGGNWPSSPAAFQKAQELPEVKAAKEAFMEAQKKYVTAMQAAMGAKTEGNGQMAVGSSQKAGGSGQPTPASGQPAKK